ncbi:MAG: HPF/RaiA family ribosome-associated protein [Paludibacteraceae bacterium]|nr:HPF/RaiA family ribosome-associated protein [Candidatus Physcocola equi]MCQ2234578.1 HPF/RaiA family ribosome-associated protein [Paludibacteraceae bacterium]
MKVNIQAIDFNAKEQLEEFVQKKAEKLEQYSDKISAVDVHMKVVKPEVSNNKEVMLKVEIPGKSLVVIKTADSFEEAYDHCQEVAIKLIIKEKEKNQK